MSPNIIAHDIPAEIVPRREATSDDLKLLGLALATWSEEELRPGGVLRFIDNIVLTELIGGDDPSEVVFSIFYGETDEECLTIVRRTPPHADPAEAARRLIVACSFHGSGYDRQRTVESLRGRLPANLIEDVLIEGRSWELP
jgi:hypothetical protein